VVGVATGLVALPVGALALLLAMGLLIFWLLPNYEVGPFHLRPLLIALPVNVLQVFVVWLLFKLFTITRHNLRSESLLTSMRDDRRWSVEQG